MDLEESIDDKDDMDRFSDMCLSAGAEPVDGHDYMGCKIGGRQIQVKDDLSRAIVDTDDALSNPVQIRGHVKDVEEISMTGIGDKSKTIEVEGDDGTVTFTNHEAKEVNEE